jgi:hypothetical protein
MIGPARRRCDRPRNRQVYLWLLLIFAVAGPEPCGFADQVGTANSDPANLPPDERATALLAALESYETSIESLQWEQDSYIAPSEDRRRHGWEVMERSTRYIDSGWRYFHRSTFSSIDPPARYEPTFDESLYFGNGIRCVTLNIENHRGMLTQPDGFSAEGCQIWRVMGRTLDYGNHVYSRPLYLALRDATSIEFLDSTPECPWPGLRAEGALFKGSIDVEVRLDPERGFAPRVIRTFRRSDGLEMETLAALSYMLADGVWIPEITIQGTRTSVQAGVGALTELTDSHKRDVAVAVTMAGLPDNAKTPELRRWINEITLVTPLANPSLFSGPLGWNQQNEPLLSPQICVARNAHVNVTMTWDQMFAVLPDDGKFFSGLTGEWLTTQQVRETFMGLLPAALPHDRLEKPR